MSLTIAKQQLVYILTFSKAIGHVNHEISLNNLFHCGIRGPVYIEFQSYMSGRSHYVTYNVEKSTKAIKSGVPQESISGHCCSLYIWKIYHKAA